MQHNPDISIIIPAWNEENLILKTIHNIKHALKNIKLSAEIIVVNNCSTDKTKELLQNENILIIDHNIRSIAGSRNKGAKASNGKYLFFIDADTWPQKQHFEKSSELMINQSYAGGGFTVKCDELNSKFAVLMLKLWNKLSLAFQAPAGCMLFVRKDIFLKSHGFNEKVYASEEIWFFKRVKKTALKHNLKTKVINYPVMTSGRKMNHSLLYLSSVIFLSIFPFLVRSRYFCRAWYGEETRQS